MQPLWNAIAASDDERSWNDFYNQNIYAKTLFIMFAIIFAMDLLAKNISSPMVFNNRHQFFFSLDNITGFW